MKRPNIQIRGTVEGEYKVNGIDPLQQILEDTTPKLKKDIATQMKVHILTSAQKNIPTIYHS